MLGLGGIDGSAERVCVQVFQTLCTKMSHHIAIMNIQLPEKNFENKAFGCISINFPDVYLSDRIMDAF